MSTSTQLLLLCALVGVVYTSHTGTNYCWTRWFNRDNPGKTGDWETLHNFPESQVCPRPVGIECQTTSGQPYQSTGTCNKLNMSRNYRIANNNNNYSVTNYYSYILCMLQKLLSPRTCAARDEVIWRLI